MILSIRYITSMHVISRSEIWGVNPLSTRFFSVPSRSGSVRGFKNSSNTGKRREQGRGIRSKHLLQSMIYRELRHRHPNYKVTMAATLQIWDPPSWYLQYSAVASLSNPIDDASFMLIPQLKSVRSCTLRSARQLSRGLWQSICCSC